LGDRLGRSVPFEERDWRPSDQKVYVSDIRKAERELGWRPEVPVRDGVDRLLEWVREHADRFSHLAPVAPPR
jgi:CDP-paratose 2-epimerase